MKINILDKKVYNRIAAGEVVERPFSVIKELVENSIDAGSTSISVSIWNGGKDRMEIEDNGCGIEKEELHKALLPHATSKIADVADLDKILTLGFRGEALASIASVSKVTIVSKPNTQEFGAKIYSEGGNVSDVIDFPSNGGTKITVDSLFFNTPVRAKFLKSTRAEEGDITDIMGRLVIANPTVSFKYFVDDKLVLQSYGGGEQEAMLSVYGANTVKNCFEIQTVKNGIGIKGYVGKHNFTKPNRTYQTLIINGRYVVNSTVSVAVQNAYQAYLMKRQYPFFVLYLDIPTEEVDVNVHPNKTDVRFSNNQVIYSAVYGVVSRVLDGTNEALEIIKNSFSDNEKEQTEQIASVAVKENAQNLQFNSALIGAKEQKLDKKEVVERRAEKVEKPQSPKANNFAGGEEFYLSFASVMDVASEKREKKEIVDVFAENKKYIEEMERKQAEKEKSEANKEKQNNVEKTIIQNSNNEKLQEDKNSLETNQNAFIEQKNVQSDMNIAHEFMFVGQAMKTYLIFERRGDLYFIDQHAAHERLLFDSLCEKMENGERVTQPLLIPYVLNLNSIERGYFETRIVYLLEMGFGIEDFGGNSYKITEIPVELANINLDKFFAEIISDNSLKQEKMPEIIREKLCQRACKSAIKAGDDLSKSEIDALMKKIGGNMGLKCPHGRPVAVKITGTEIEKWFKRIV